MPKGFSRSARQSISILVSIVMISIPCWGQEEVESNSDSFHPTLGIGAGVLGFYGDIGEQHREYSPMLSRIAFELRATTPINDWLEGGIYVIHGSVGANERSLTRNLNFESKITTGGIRFRYNFDQFLSRKRSVEPFITVGFESMEFLSKTDRYDKEGRLYHYWSDGTIRDLAESSPNAANSVLLERDYIYESDIRELDIDGFGKYLERTWALPVGIGVQTRIAEGVDLRMGTTLHMSFSDLIDGVTDESIEGRTGDSRNDMFLFSSFTLGYRIKTGVRKPSPTELTPDLLAYLNETEDEDGDGVTDMLDRSPFTPEGVDVDEFGVPIDKDEDAVSDYLDEEPLSEKGAPVHPNGVTITDEEFLLAYQIFMDSTGEFAAVAHSMAESQSLPSGVTVKRKRKFVIQVGNELEGIAPSMVDRILGLPDVRSVDLGDTTFLVVGNYTDLPDAIRRQDILEGQGITGSVMEETKTGLRDVSDEVNDLLPLEPAAEEILSSSILRVQLGAFRYPLSKNIFKEVKDLVVLKGEDGLTRYYSGNFENIADAAAFKVDKLLEGFEGAFLVAFKEGKRVSLSEVGGTLTRPESFEVQPSRIDKSRISYRIQVGEFTGDVPSDMLEKFIDLGKTRAMREDGVIKYIHGKFKTKAEVEQQLTKVKEMGLPDAFIIGDFNGTLISAEQADRLLAE